MKCDLCGINESIIFVQQVANEQTVDLRLCMECAKKHGFSVTDKKFEISISSLLSDLLQAKSKQLFPDDKLCPCCAHSMQTLLKTKKVGCAECYTAFREHVAFCTKKTEAMYNGSLPKRLANFRSTLTDRMFYQSRLEKAVANEDYEKAAMYRDCLRALESNPINDGEIISHE